MCESRAGLGNYRRRPMNNAYMLVYIRETDWESVMAPTTGEEVEETVREQLKAELSAKEHKRRERMQAHRYVTFKIVTKALVREHVRPPPRARAPSSACRRRQVMRGRAPRSPGICAGTDSAGLRRCRWRSRRST